MDLQGVGWGRLDSKGVLISP